MFYKKGSSKGYPISYEMSQNVPGEELRMVGYVLPRHGKKLMTETK